MSYHKSGHFYYKLYLNPYNLFPYFIFYLFLPLLTCRGVSVEVRKQFQYNLDSCSYSVVSEPLRSEYIICLLFVRIGSALEVNPRQQDSEWSSINPSGYTQQSPIGAFYWRQRRQKERMPLLGKGM